jgi:outer membrane receptor for ferrienterochelin and colicin
VVYQATLAEHWLVMGLKTNDSPVDTWLFNMEAAIENIVSFAVVGNLAINQLMEHEAATTVTAKVASSKEPKWTIMMAKNVHQVVNRGVETLVDVPKQEEQKLNLRLTGFEAKEGETEKELVQQLNTELL